MKHTGINVPARCTEFQWGFTSCLSADISEVWIWLGMSAGGIAKGNHLLVNGSFLQNRLDLCHPSAFPALFCGRYNWIRRASGAHKVAAVLPASLALKQWHGEMLVCGVYDKRVCLIYSVIKDHCCCHNASKTGRNEWLAMLCIIMYLKHQNILNDFTPVGATGILKRNQSLCGIIFLSS